MGGGRRGERLMKEQRNFYPMKIFLNLKSKVKSKSVSAMTDLLIIISTFPPRCCFCSEVRDNCMDRRTCQHLHTGQDERSILFHRSMEERLLWRRVINICNSPIVKHGAPEPIVLHTNVDDNFNEYNSPTLNF